MFYKTRLIAVNLEKGRIDSTDLNENYEIVHLNENFVTLYCNGNDSKINLNLRTMKHSTCSEQNHLENIHHVNEFEPNGPNDSDDSDECEHSSDNKQKNLLPPKKKNELYRFCRVKRGNMKHATKIEIWSVLKNDQNHQNMPILVTDYKIDTHKQLGSCQAFILTYEYYIFLFVDNQVRIINTKLSKCFKKSNIKITKLITNDSEIGSDSGSDSDIDSMNFFRNDQIMMVHKLPPFHQDYLNFQTEMDKVVLFPIEIIRLISDFIIKN